MAASGGRGRRIDAFPRKRKEPSSRGEEGGVEMDKPARKRGSEEERFTAPGRALCHAGLDDLAHAGGRRQRRHELFPDPEQRPATS